MMFGYITEAVALFNAMTDHEKSFTLSKTNSCLV
jgi:hypothetical protein